MTAHKITFTPVVCLKLLVALVHALLPLAFALGVATEPASRDLSSWTLLALKAFPLISVAILTYELLLLRRGPNTLGPMLALFLTPPILILLQSLLRGTFPRSELWFEAATFYLGLFLLTFIVISCYRIFWQRAFTGWELPLLFVVLLVLLVSGLTVFFVFVETLIDWGGFAGWQSRAVFVVALIVAAISEVKIVLAQYPGPRQQEAIERTTSKGSA